LLKQVIGSTMGDGVTMVDSAEATAEETAQLLERHGLLNRSAARSADRPSDQPSDPVAAGASRFYVTDAAGRFHRMAERILGEPLDHLEAVEVWGHDKLETK